MADPMSLSRRLAAAWAAFTGRSPRPQPEEPGPVRGTSLEEARLAAEADAASARIELELVRKEVNALRRTMEAERAGREEAIAEALAARLEPSMAEIAELLAQLALQRRFIAEGQPIRPSDVAILAAGLADTLRRLGLEPIGAPGDAVAFDPEQHQTLAGPRPAYGTAATVRMPGYQFAGRVIRRVSVKPTA